jgi:hypothetical protein
MTDVKRWHDGRKVVVIDFGWTNVRVWIGARYDVLSIGAWSDLPLFDAAPARSGMSHT